MSEDIKTYRHRAAQAARAYLSNPTTWDQFMQEFGSADDELVSELVDLIEHLPKRGGIFGLSEKKWIQYQSKIAEAILALDS